MDGYNSSEGSFAGALPGVSHMQNGILPSMSLGTGEPGPAESTSGVPCQMEIEPGGEASVTDLPPHTQVSSLLETPPPNGESGTHDQEPHNSNPTHADVNFNPVRTPTSTNPVWGKLTGKRIFLDICCGVNSPLSAAVQDLHGDRLRFDILIHSTDDLLDSTRFEQLLRVCASGIVAYSAASPACCEYNRLKLFLLHCVPHHIWMASQVCQDRNCKGSKRVLKCWIDVSNVCISQSLQVATLIWGNPNRQ